MNAAAGSAHHEAMPTNTDANIAVMSVEIRYIRQAVDDIKEANRLNVSRTEWEQRNSYVDGRFGDVQKDLAARKVPWTSVAALVVSASVLLFDLIPRLAN